MVTSLALTPADDHARNQVASIFEDGVIIASEFLWSCGRMPRQYGIRIALGVLAIILLMVAIATNG